MKQYRLLLVMFLSTLGVNAQDAHSVLLNLYGSYSFADKVEYSYSHGSVEEGFQYGVGLEFFLAKTSAIELRYQRLDTHLPLYGPLGNQLNAGDDKGALNYILLDGNHYFETGNQKMLPYVGAGIGVGIIETPQSGDDTNFAWDIKAGVKIKTNSAVSINLNMYLQSMTAAVGDSYYWTYYGLVGVTDYLSTYQFGLGASLCYDFKRNKK